MPTFCKLFVIIFHCNYPYLRKQLLVFLFSNWYLCLSHIINYICSLFIIPWDQNMLMIEDFALLSLSPDDTVAKVRWNISTWIYVINSFSGVPPISLTYCWTLCLEGLGYHIRACQFKKNKIQKNSSGQMIDFCATNSKII